MLISIPPNSYKILVADDYDSNLAVIESIFEESGQVFEIIYAHDGQAAYEMAILEVPDLIIMDWEMPQMTGIEALRKLKERKDTQHIPIIMTTAFTSSEHLQTALQAGAIDYVKKPIDEVELLARVNSALQLVTSYKQILIQKDEIQEKTKKLEAAFGQIEKKNDKIMSSIKYAKRIQDALLQPTESLKNVLEDSFILYKPRDVVSGDFYWFFEKNDKIVIAAVDCTGHGVPGAFMSMLGDTYLNQVVGVMGIIQPNEILSQLHESIRTALKQDATQNRDGMDISICVIDKKDRTLKFAGAKNPLVYIRDNEIIRIKGDTNSIGGKSGQLDFTTHTIKLTDQPTPFYIYSDGYQDQFSSGMDSKFMAKRFRKLLHKIHKYPFAEQKDILNHILKDWMRQTRQVDDILVIGFAV